ncbi:Uncharacterised protein [Phocoenobacter uteri]|uniref:Uncharacterized protein n=1 Tax=Phocoenobacter uteri TaxID=146806 RepID=A0A379CAD3_9PAST|nr:hypothetical protein [Phocoenobacter uteri]SUB59098.1 Uncharacterised protein [Phocoenobacter uteri]
MVNPTQLDIAVHFYHFFANKFYQTGEQRYWIKTYKAWQMIAELRGKQQWN